MLQQPATMFSVPKRKPIQKLKVITSDIIITMQNPSNITDIKQRETSQIIEI